MDLTKELKTSISQPDPETWISRVVIYKQVQPNPLPIRDIALSRGLNIIWAEEAEEEDPTADITGHSAGKTTFCRLLRYILGERTFSTKNGMELIRQTFPHGYITAELRISGKKWAVRRPFGRGKMSYILADASVEQLLEKGGKSVSQENYIKDLGFDSLIDCLAAGDIARTGEIIQWGHVLAWCSRDQEARFQNIFEWRSPRSESEAPSFRFPKVGPLFVMRTVLGLFLPSELSNEDKLAKLQIEQDQLTKELERKKQEPQFRVNLYEQDLKQQLGNVLPDTGDLIDTPIHSMDLFSDDLAHLTSNATEQLTETLEFLQQKKEEQQEALDSIGVKLKLLEEEQVSLKALLSLSQQSEKELSINTSQNSLQQEIQQKLNAQCLYGGVPFGKCHHVTNRLQVLQFKDAQDGVVLEKYRKEREGEQVRLQNELARLDTSIEEAKADQREIKVMRDALSNEYVSKEEKLRLLKITFDNLNTWLEIRDHGAENRDIGSIGHRLHTLGQTIMRTEEELATLLDQHSSNRTLLSTIFSSSVRAVIRSGAYDGKVSFENRELKFTITKGHAIIGEAVETLAVLLSDISCLIYNTVSDTSRLPGFLLHDSPREADLGKRLYHSLIRFVAEVEAQFDEGECPFQYILTTTTAPPNELQSDEHIPLRLNAAKSNELLFRCNFTDSQKQLEMWDQKVETAGEKHSGE